MPPRASLRRLGESRQYGCVRANAVAKTGELELLIGCVDVVVVEAETNEQGIAPQNRLNRADCWDASSTANEQSFLLKDLL